MAQYSIKDLEKVTGIKAHTIRIWEKRYGIVEPVRSDTNIRSYTDNDLKKLLNISLLNRHGIKISKLANMSLDEIQKMVIDLTQKPEDADSKIDSLLMAMIDLDENRFTETYNFIVDKIGFESAFINVLRPFMNKAGVLWMAGTINPAQEHFVSNLVRQKLIAEIDKLDSLPLKNAKHFLLFLPEGELHELGILFMYYLIKKRGHIVLYFGQSTPISSIIEAAELWQPDFLVFSLVNPMVFNEIDSFLERIRASFPDQKILVNGYQTKYITQEKLKDLVFVNDYEAFSTYLDKLI